MGYLGCLAGRRLWAGLTPAGRPRESRYPLLGLFVHLRLGHLGWTGLRGPKSVRFFKLNLPNALPPKLVYWAEEIQNLELTESGEDVP